MWKPTRAYESNLRRSKQLYQICLIRKNGAKSWRESTVPTPHRKSAFVSYSIVWVIAFGYIGVIYREILILSCHSIRRLFSFTVAFGTVALRADMQKSDQSQMRSIGTRNWIKHWSGIGTTWRRWRKWVGRCWSFGNARHKKAR